jgi:predicted permease
VKLWKYFRAWRRSRQFEADLAEEIRLHRELSGEAAFGSVALALEQSREVWGLAWLESWKQDVRYALRGFRRSPAFALGVVATIGLGLGVNTTMFTVMNSYALRPYAVRDPHALYGFFWSTKKGGSHNLSWQQYQDLGRQPAPFSEVLAYWSFPAQIEGATVLGEAVSSNYFGMLSAPIALGRPLLPQDNGPVMIVSYMTWRNRFGSDPALLGRKIYVRGQPFDVVGIAAPGFEGVDSFPVGLWIPARMASSVLDGDPFAVGQTGNLRLIGRLLPGVSAKAAQAPLLVWIRHFEPAAIGIEMLSHATAVPINRDTLAMFLPLLVAFGLVLAIACANVSNMMLARALSRQREIAIRVSLGAGRARLLRQLLTESVLLALPAAATGFAISEATMSGAQRLLFTTIPPALGRLLAIEDLSPDWRVFGFLLGASVITAILFGFVPALQTIRSRIVETNRGDFSSDYRPSRLRNLLVIAQVAVCALLLISTAIVLRGEWRARAQPVGLDLRGVWDVRLIARHQPKVFERLSVNPDVEAVASAWRAPLYGALRRLAVIRSGRKEWASYNLVSPGYFAVFRIPLLRGRLFTQAEADTEAPVVMVGEGAARRLWPGQEAVGQTVQIALPTVRPDPYWTRLPQFASARIVGVVRDLMSGIPADLGAQANFIDFYFPTHAGAVGNDSVLVRLRYSSAARQHLEAALDRIAPNVADFLNPMDDVLALQIYPFRAAGWIAEFLAGIALVMTVSGVYGVMAYLVTQRTKEIGIRVALGADRGNILRMVLRQSAMLAAIGATVGIACALAVAPLFAHELAAIQPYDWLPYTATAAVVFLAAFAASFAPARLAVTIDPVRTLRCD